MSEAWRLRAACATLSPEEADRLFFGRGDANAYEGRRLCMACPVRAACLEAADRYEGRTCNPTYLFGTWGGLFATERGRRRRAAQPNPETAAS